METTPLHTRTLSIETHPFASPGRAGDADGGERLAVHAELRDVRHVDLPAYMGFEHPAGVVHHMALRLELDRELVIRAADAQMMTAPFEPSDKTRGEGCRHILPGYAGLVGLRIDEAYPLRVMEEVGGPRGCFHILSLAQCVPAAVRAATRRLCAGALRMPEGARGSVADSCSQWRSDGPLWRHASPAAGSGFRSFRRIVDIRAGTPGGEGLVLDGRLRDEPDGGAPFGARLSFRMTLPKLEIASAEARLDPPPFPGCEGALDGVTHLHRLSVSKGFTGAALEKIGGGAGCAHLSALVIAMTAVVPQAAGGLAGHLGWAPDRRARETRVNPQADTCHMWRSGGPLLRPPAGREENRVPPENEPPAPVEDSPRRRISR